MTPLFKKLNLGPQKEILVLNAPESFETELQQLSDITIHRQVVGLKKIEFALVFVQTLAELEASAKWLKRAEGDAIIWFAYPKKSSHKYTCEFHRDTGWDVIGAEGFEGVRMVAIDTDWSALRFRRTEYIKTLKRDITRASSAAGKKRIQQGKDPGK